MADLLVVESLLRWYGYSIEDWERSLYANAPNVQIKVPVIDRSKYKTTYEETVLLEPEGVQEQINALVAKYNGARAFVRPSGTENIVRVYAEAETSEEASALGQSIADLIKTL
ncbi:phosphoglucomutase/phosphomannomutase protein [Cooperia oncophora]